MLSSTVGALGCNVVAELAGNIAVWTVVVSGKVLASTKAAAVRLTAGLGGMPKPLTELALVVGARGVEYLCL